MNFTSPLQPLYRFTFRSTSNGIFHNFYEFPAHIFVSSTLIIQAQRLHFYRVYVVRCALQISMGGRGQGFIAWLATLFLWPIKPQKLHSVMSKETKRKRKSSLRPKEIKDLYTVSVCSCPI